MARVFSLFVSAILAACSSPDLSGTNFSCVSDADCKDGKVCGRVNGVPACVATSHVPIVLGMTGPLQGPSRDLGAEMQRGMNAMFKRVNDHGGVFGRQIQLTCLNEI